MRASRRRSRCFFFLFFLFLVLFLYACKKKQAVLNQGTTTMRRVVLALAAALVTPFGIVVESQPPACTQLPGGTGLNVTWPAVSQAVLYELQIAKAPPPSLSSTLLSKHVGDEIRQNRAEWTVSITSAGPTVEVERLAPSTEYWLKVRSTQFNEVSGWTFWQPRFSCSTTSAGPSVSLDHTAVSRRMSRPIERRSCPDCKFLPVVRISERNATETDFLSNHDVGDVEGDSLFMTSMGSGGKFIPSFNNSVVTQFCIEVAPGPFADYVSCNPPDTGKNATTPPLPASLIQSPDVFPNATQVCVCDNEFDRRVGHKNATPACGAGAVPWGLCNCSAASMAASAHTVGAMQTFLPFVCGSAQEGDGTCNTSIPFGNWYSLPSGAQCAEGELIGAGKSTLLGVWLSDTNRSKLRSLRFVTPC